MTLEVLWVKSTGPVFCEEINSSLCVKSILTQFFGKLTEEEKM